MPRNAKDIKTGNVIFRILLSKLVNAIGYEIFFGFSRETSPTQTILASQPIFSFVNDGTMLICDLESPTCRIMIMKKNSETILKI